MRMGVFVVAVAALAASATAEVVERIVAKVNGAIITQSELDAEIDAMIERLGPAPSLEEEQKRRKEIGRQILERMIDNMLVLQVAEERGLRVPPRYFEEWKAKVMEESKIETEDELLRQLELQGLTLADLRKQFEEGVLIQEIRRMEVDNKISVTEDEIAKRYRERIADYTEPAKVRLREIVVRFDAAGGVEAAEAKARRLLQDIRQGADFADVARRYSDGSSRDAGGDLGFFSKDELTEALAEIAFALEPGEVSDVVRMENAFYIIKVDEKTEEKILTLEEVRRQIADTIFQEKLEEQTKRYIQKLREQAIIDVRY